MHENPLSVVLLRSTGIYCVIHLFKVSLTKLHNVDLIMKYQMCKVPINIVNKGKGGREKKGRNERTSSKYSTYIHVCTCMSH